MCGGPKDSRGAPSVSQKESQMVRIYADYFSTQSRTMIAVLDYCQISYDLEVIDSKFGVIKDDSLFSSVIFP
jgi:hypothetical protein